MNALIYLDNNATTAVAPEVLEAMTPYFTEFYGNPSSIHAFGAQVSLAVQKAREQVAALLGAAPSEILFTSCGTESDNTAIQGILSASQDKKHIITTSVEHPAILQLCRHLDREGFDVTFLPVDSQGLLEPSQLEDAIRKDTALITVMWANNETGVLSPVEEIAQIAAERGIPFHTDAVQAVGKIRIDLGQTPVDLLSLSGHKLHAPKGVGVLYVRKGCPLEPLLRGGHQEQGRRAGTENVPSIVALGKACELALAQIEEEQTLVAEMRDHLERQILSRIPETVRHGHPTRRLPNTSSIGFRSVEGESILLSLSRENIAASSGSACSSGSLEPSHVLKAMSVDPSFLNGTVRFSLSRYNTRDQMDRTVSALEPIIGRLREMSPFWPPPES